MSAKSPLEHSLSADLEEACTIICESCRQMTKPATCTYKKEQPYRVANEFGVWWRHPQISESGEYKGLIACDAYKIREHFYQKGSIESESDEKG